MINENIKAFAAAVSGIIDQEIRDENIHNDSKGRYYYIQSPKAGAPMLLHHYRGPFFIDIHPDDYKKIESGEVTAEEYITTANWLVGYFWGGGSMVGGGYYQPMDIVAKKEEVRRYLKILSCKGFKHSCGYDPSEKSCANCNVDKCPFSKYKEGTWEAEMQEPDPRVTFFKALSKTFEEKYPGYELKGFLCSDRIPENEIWISPNGRYTEKQGLAFTAHASSDLIRSLLMHEVEPTIPENLIFEIHKLFSEECVVATPETVAKAYEGMDYTIKKETAPTSDIYEEKIPLTARIAEFFKRIF